jgi:hypothetical protein
MVKNSGLQQGRDVSGSPHFGAFCTAKQTHSTIFGISVMVRGIVRRKSNNGMIFRNKTDFFPWPARATVGSGTAV